MKGNHIKYLTAFGIIAILSIFIIQIFWIKEAFNITESQFEHNTTVALRQVAEKIAVKNKTNFLQHNPVIKINPRLYVVQVNSEIDANLLDHYLKVTFDYFNIDIDVEYSIYSCQNDELVYCNYIQKKKPQKNATTPELPNFTDIDYYFSVSFPNYPIISMNNIPMWMITSAVLILVVLFFIYALFVVFAQKSISQIQREFINNMTHEFKTPISTISIIQQAISDPDIVKNPRRLATYTEIIGEEINRLNDQVEKVLNISRLEKRQVELKLEMIDIHEVIEQIIHNLSNIETEKKVNFVMDLRAERISINADRVHFTNVVCNIIENATKYSGDDVTIKITTTDQNNSMIIAIQDNGEGIEKKELKKIFEKFYRVPKGDTHNVKGFGLGLFYVKQIAKAHGWKLDATSIYGQGTTFYLIIDNNL
ncbi:MAG: HAMP domain-containing histidine kinase [Saprospiraceae bacterium]|nr:HAMP domain-containing histidine kinase [Saprospiraceae bacterium]